MRPLDDIRIIAVEQYGAGPWGSVHLADLGADVIKVEDPHTRGDVGRYVPPYQEDEDSLFFETFNRNKRSISIDITSKAGREVFEDLVREADAVYSNLRGDVPAKLGITYNALKEANQQIVCCSLSAYGMNGPRATDPGYDYMVQGLAGWMRLTGEPDSPPQKTGLSLVDFSSGFVAAIALLAGIHAARRDGVGMDCDLSLFDTAISLLNYPATWHLNEGFEPRRTRHSAHPSLVPFQNFQTADGWIVVGCAKEKFWNRLAEAMNLDDLANDPRFDTFADRDEHRNELLGLLETRFRDKPADEWLEILGQAGVPVAPIHDVESALKDSQVAERGLIIETEHTRWGKVRTVASPVRVGSPRSDHRRAPQRNEHGEQIMAELLNYTTERVSALTDAGAFDTARASDGVEAPE